MNAYTTPPFLRRRLGRRLRAMRQAAGFTLQEAAARLDKTRSSLHRIETGETRADVHLIRSMMDLYDCWEEGLLDQTREARRPMWFRRLGVASGTYLDLETLCCQVSEFGSLLVPGLLQTESYIRAIFAASTKRHTAAQIDTAVTVRQIRQRRLTSADDVLDLVAVVDESVLRREVGGSDVMYDQLMHMVKAAALPNVTIQVLPLRRGAFCAMDGPFVVLGFPDPSDPELLFVEYITGALNIEDPEEVREVKLKFAQLRADALSPADSIELIERIAGELDRP